MTHRLYSFINHLYMSPIQWGIQTAHVVSTLSVKYNKGCDQEHAYREWASDEPTILICQGGNVASLNKLQIELNLIARRLMLPQAEFNEDENSLGGIITAVGILVPENIFSCTFEGYHDLRGNNSIPIYKRTDGSFVSEDQDEYKLLSIIKTARLA